MALARIDEGRGRVLGWAAVILTGLAASMLAWNHQVGGWGVETDFYSVYLPQAREIMDGWPLVRGVVHNPPGFAGLVGALGLVVGNEFTAAVIWSVIGTMGLVWATAQIGQAAFGPFVGAFAAALVGCTLLPFSYLAATDALGAFLIVLPLALLARWPAPTNRGVFGLGLLIGLAYLVRSNAVVVLPVIALGLLTVVPVGRAIRRRAITVLWLGLGVITTVVPWLVVNATATGSGTGSTAHLQIAAHFFGGSSGDAYAVTTFPLMAAKFHSLADVLRYDPVALVARYIQDVVLAIPLQLLLDGARFPGLLLVGIGLLGGTTKSRAIALGYWAVFVLGALLLALVGYVPRYYLFAFPGIAFLMAIGARRLILSTEDTRLGTFAAAGLIGFSALSLLVFSLRDATRQVREEPKHLLALADSIRSITRPGDIVFGRKPHLAVLAGRAWAFAPVSTADSLVQSARLRGARLMIYSDFEANLWPALKPLKDPSLAPNGLVLRFRDAATNTNVYELTP